MSARRSIKPIFSVYKSLAGSYNAATGDGKLPAATLGMSPISSSTGTWLDRWRAATRGYPRQFWILFWGMLINAAGTSMVWPFLTLYMRQKLGTPLTTITLLLTLNSVAGLLSTTIVGPLVDRFGRKGAMLLSLAVGGLNMFLMSRAGTLPGWAVLMAISGTFGPLYNVGSNAMIADLIEPERRVSAYALLRMIANLGIAIGPAVGGFVTRASYAWAFYIGAGAQLTYGLIVLLLTHETRPQNVEAHTAPAPVGYGPVLRDRPFLAFCAAYTLGTMGYSLMMVLLPVYAKEQFGVLENQYGFIMATNAAMVVFLQFATTRLTTRFHHLRVLAVGALFYAVGLGSVGLGRSFPAFLLSMVVLTIGEMVTVPTATTLTANVAPLDMRGRYMSVFGLTWGVGFGIGPVLGGWLSDNVAPRAIWYAGFSMALISALAFVVLTRALKEKVEAAPSAA